MELEIFLEMSEAGPQETEVVEKRFLDWHAEGAEIRYDKVCFGRLTRLDRPFSFLVDIGEADPLEVIRDLHARLYRFGAKVFVHFIPS